MKKRNRGFTLVELLVVISIIAILSVIGLTIYSTVQKNVRNTRRKADINAIAAAMEANYGKTTKGQYDALVTTMFSSGIIPTDPTDTSGFQYCFAEGVSEQTLTACAATGGNYITGATLTVPTGQANLYWVICANLEGGGAYCRHNSQ